MWNFAYDSGGPAPENTTPAAYDRSQIGPLFPQYAYRKAMSLQFLKFVGMRLIIPGQVFPLFHAEVGSTAPHFGVRHIIDDPSDGD
jgi:hypothetical protein